MIEVHCSACNRTVEKETRAEAEELVNSHNESRHDGDDVAVVVGETDPMDGFLDLLDDPHERSRLFYAHRNSGVYRSICMECERIEIHDDVDKAWEVVAVHNDFAHDGESVAGVVQEDIEEETDRRLPIDGPSAVELLAEIQRTKTIKTD